MVGDTIWRIALGSVWPSARRALSTVLSVFSIPLLVLAAISAAKLIQLVGLIQPQGFLKIAIEWQSYVIDFIRMRLEEVRLPIPTSVFDIGVFYVFVGNAVARAEKDELLAVILDDGTAWTTLRDALKEWRPEFFFYSLPPRVRGVALRALWPLAAIYRFGTPWVVDGPGPHGEEISTSVPRGDLLEFARMVAESGLWTQQTIYDHRLVLCFQIGLGIASSLGLQLLAKLL